MATKSESRSVRDFTEVEMQGYGDLFVEQNKNAEIEGLTIEADENILPRIKSEVRGNRLVLGYAVDWWDWLYWIDWLFNPNKKVVFHLTMKRVNGAAISGSGKLTSNHIETDSCRLKISGSGKVQIGEIQAQSLETNISGSGDVELAGQAPQHAIHISGSGRIKALDLRTQCTSAHISGSGSAQVDARESLDVHISGSGSIRYTGQPKISEHISGSGRIVQIK